jgi:hypothetical protein
MEGLGASFLVIGVLLAENVWLLKDEYSIPSLARQVVDHNFGGAGREWDAD